MKKRLLSLLCALALCLSLLPGTALAADSVSYVEYSWNEERSTLTSETRSVSDYTTVTSSVTVWGTSGQTTWYVVSDNVDNYGRGNIEVSGTVNLILTSGKTLTLNGPNISLQDSSAVLNIYGQAGNTGKLSITAGNSSGDAGINLNGGTLNIHGGTVTATGHITSASKSAPGIDVGTSTLTVYGGEVTAEAGTHNSAGYGAGIRVVTNGTVNIHGGTVTATGASFASTNDYPGAGIGGSGSNGETCGTVTITGGTVTATGGDGYQQRAAAGIGGGAGNSSSAGGGGNVIISGGTVTANGGKASRNDNVQAPGIGGAVYSSSSGGAGTFSTGTNGSAVITTTGGIQAGTSGCSAIIDNKVYGNVTLPDSQLSSKNLTVTNGATLTISGEKTLSSSITVNDGGTLTVSGTVTNSGTITVESGGTLTGTGTINNTDSGKVTGDTGNVKVTYPSTVEVSSSTSGTAVLGQEVTFTATVTGNDTAGTPTGTVQFKDGETNLGEAVALEDGVATYTANNGLDVGEHPITAEYTPAGDAAYTGSSGSLTFTVVGDVASISVQTQPTTMTYTTGQALDLTGLVITLHYDGTDYTSEVSWGTDSGTTSDPENGTELQASEHNDKAVTITYEGQSAQTSALSVSKANQTGFAFTEESPKEVDYSPNGTFTVKVEGGEGTGAVTYTVTEGTGVISIDGNTATILKVGTATITATKAADVDYNEATATLTVTVNSKSLENAQVQVSGEYTYDGNAKEPSGNAVTVTLDGKTLIENTDYTLSYSNNTDAGEATVTATAAENGNYTGSATDTFTIAPATPTVTGVTAQGRAYDGSATVTITGVTLGGVSNYNNDDVSVDMDNSNLTGTLSSADAGTYYELTLTGTASLTGKGANNYTLTLPSEGINVTTVNQGNGVTISKATSSISINNTYNPGKTYDGTALANPTESELTLTGAGYNNVTFTWYEGTSPNGTKLDSAPTDAGTYYLVASISESNNTSGSEATSEAITISPKLVSNPTITLSGTSFEYTSSEIKPEVLSVKDGDTVIPTSEYTVSYSDNTNVGTATVTIVDAAGGNYTVSGSINFTITKAKATVTEPPTANTLTYTGQAQELVTAGTATGGTMQYSTEENGTYSTDIPTGTNAGDYTVWYKVVGDENHSDTQPVKIEVTIAGVSITDDNVTLSTTEFTYNGQEQKPTVTVTLDDKNLVVDTDYEVSYDPTEVKDAGTYTVTVTGKGSYEGTVQKTFTIQKADPAIGNVTYGGGVLYESTALNSITLNRSNTTVPGTLKLDAGQTLRADVSSYKWTFTPDDADNYETVTGTVELTVQADTLTGLSVQANPSKAEYVYGDFFDKTGLVLEVTYESGNKKEISADEITVETTGPLTCDMTAVTVSYQGMECQVPVTVNKATYSGQTTVTGTIWANTASEVQLPQPPDGATFGDPVYSVVSDTVVRVEITGNTLAYEGGTGITKGQEYKITVPVNGGTNYNDYDITVTLIGTDKKVPTGAPTLSTTTITYGQSLSTITLSGSMQDGAETVTGTFTWDAPTTTPDAGSYEAHWTFTPADGNLYVSVSGTTTITVNKATPRGTPKYTAITTSGKTLADAGLTTEGGTFSVPGTVAWEQADTTQVQTNTAYTWKFTPTDSDNYNSISGSITLYVVSSSGGGGGSSGGGSSSSGSQTETTTNPDGSTTTTVTSSNGTVTETTKNPDGSQKVVETKKDGTVTTTTTDTTGNKTQVVENPDGSSQTTVTNKDGSGSVTLVDENGQVVSEATLSQSAVAAAQEKGEAVALPMPSVPVTSDRENAPTVTVDLPVGGSVQVEIPVENVTAGTVAVIVKADGTEEVIKTSLTTENGVAVTLSDGDTVKVVDNSKTFADVPGNYWGAEAVTFASSRELFAGTSATTFAPDTVMTRAMIVTVLARFEGVDTTTGSTWYEAGQQWAMENGVSDGTNMDASLTREQLATMLWRYAGSPSVSDNLSGYTDADTVSSYAQQAMVWCVEQGIIGGTTTTTLSPQGPATRAQVATILMRYIENIA